jgi:hypothetical protein
MATKVSEGTQAVKPRAKNLAPGKRTTVIIGKTEFGPGDGFHQEEQPLRPWRAGEKAICLAECLGHGSSGLHFTVARVRDSGGLEDERGHLHKPRTCKLDA